MNKLLFQIGIFVFFVSVVIFGVQEFSLFDTIARAFIVFITIELIGTAVAIYIAYLNEKNKKEEAQQHTETPAHSAANNE